MYAIRVLKYNSPDIVSAPIASPLLVPHSESPQVLHKVSFNAYSQLSAKKC